MGAQDGAHPLFDVTQKGHGRQETWRIQVVAIEPLEVDFPHARCALAIRHLGTRSGKPLDETRYDISNRSATARTSAPWVQAVRNHGAGVENRRHWRKDACLREDATRSRNPHLVGALALLRKALFAIHQPHLEQSGGLNGFTEVIADDISFNDRLMTRPL